MKRILCYGDSNTWGQTGEHVRYEDNKHWPNVLQQFLGSGYHVTQEGLPGRTAGNIEREKTLYNGQASFEVALCSASPLDLVIISLGTNDFKPRYERTAQDIAGDLMWYKQAVMDAGDWSEGRKTKLLYLTPANFVTDDSLPDAQRLRVDLIELMQDFPDPVLVLDRLELSSDGVHYSESTHRIVASLVQEKIKEILG